MKSLTREILHAVIPRALALGRAVKSDYAKLIIEKALHLKGFFFF
jgi:hypothetical protein